MIVPELADTRGKLVLHAPDPSAMRGMGTHGTCLGVRKNGACACGAQVIE